MNMNCPKCGFYQPVWHECRSCGVIIKKVIEIRSRGEEVKEKPRKQKSFQTKHTFNISMDKNNWINSIVQWWRAFFDVFSQLLLFIVIAWIGCTALLYICDQMWYLYLQTHVGQVYKNIFIAKANPIIFLMGISSAELALKIVGATILAIFPVSVLCQLFGVTRYFYDGHSWWVRYLLWGLFFSITVACVIFDFFMDDINMGLAFILGIIPSFGLGGIFHKFCKQLIPETNKYTVPLILVVIYYTGEYIFYPYINTYTYFFVE